MENINLLYSDNLSKTAFIYKKEDINYGEVHQNIDRLASLLDIKEEDRVIIFSENSPYWAYALFAIWKRGGIGVAVDFMSTAQEFEYILNDCDPKLILTSKEKFDVIRGIKDLPEILLIDQIDYENIQRVENPFYNRKQDTALILYTSGTTGAPKGVMLTFDNLLSNIESIEKIGIANSQDNTLAVLPFHHSYPLMVSLLIPLHLGATVIFLDRLTPEDILKKLQDYGITIFIGVPRIYNLFHRKIFERINSKFITRGLFRSLRMINSQRVGRFIFSKVHRQFGESLKYFISGGSKLDVDTARDLWALGFKIIEGYGLTETSPIVSFNPPDRIKLGSVGKVIPDVEVKIKEDGEILVKGRNVFKGYYGKEKETKESFEDGYFKTGDLGFFDEDGYLYITGRKKEIIVLPNGKNINPEEIENYITKNFPIVKEVAVVLKEGQLFAIIYPDFEYIGKEKILNIQETIKWNVIDKYNLKSVSYKRINGFIISNVELPKTRLGKIRRFMLDSFLKTGEYKKEVKEPDDEIYRLIKGYLSNLTKRSVYPDSHIEIDLGLDSLGKIEFITFLEGSFGLNLDEGFFIENQTVEKIYKFFKDRMLRLESSQINWGEIFHQETEIKICDRCIPLYIKPILATFFRLYNRLEVSGQKYIPKGPVIFASNHQSYLDGFLITASLPKEILKNTFFLAEETYFMSDFRKFIAKNSGIIIVNVNRDLKGSLVKLASAVRRGKSLVIFPEGARTRDGTVMEFKKSFAILSRELNVPIVPVTIKGAFESFPIGKRFPKPSKIKLTFLEPINPESKSYEQITKEVYNKIKENLEG